MNIEEDFKIDFKDVLIKPKRSTLTSRSEVNLTRTFKFKHTKNIWTGIPIIAANMDTIGTFDMANALSKYGMMAAIHKHYTVAELTNFFTSFGVGNYNFNLHWYTMGITDADIDKFEQIHAAMPPTYVCIDVANGYHEKFLDFVNRFAEKYYETTIMAGNVVSGEMTEALILAGADIVKVGIGGGSVCTTRIKSGVGIPQLSAIMECADAAHGLGGLICSDGGITCPGDLGKAFGAGADFVMVGGMLAGHDECGGEIIYRTYEKEVGLGVVDEDPEIAKNQIHTAIAEFHEPIAMKFYGMSSEEAMIKHNGGVAAHRTAEGKSVEVPYKGSVENTVQELLGGLRSTGTYIGASKLKEFSKRTTFVKVHTQSNEVFGRN